jgi:hyperosmotically inducible protein
MKMKDAPALILVVGILTISAFAQEPAADNTKTNQRDRGAGMVTADQQKMNRTDQQTARMIRQSVMRDKSLSTYAHNVKIIVRNGGVTLKGPVRSDQEKTSVYNKAVAVAGDGKVVNEIDVTPAK